MWAPICRWLHVLVGMGRMALECGDYIGELDVLLRRRAAADVVSCSLTLSSLSRLVQSLPSMVIMDEIGDQLKKLQMINSVKVTWVLNMGSSWSGAHNSPLDNSPVDLVATVGNLIYETDGYKPTKNWSDLS
eukprot:Gb_05373 [translate_table: standard]